MMLSSVVFKRRQCKAQPHYPDTGCDITYYHVAYDGCAASCLTPMLWLHVVSLLVHCGHLSAVSRFFAELAEDEDLWRRLCLRMVFTERFQFAGSWRKTALRRGQTASISTDLLLEEIRADIRYLNSIALPNKSIIFGFRPIHVVKWEEIEEPCFIDNLMEASQPFLIRGALRNIIVNPSLWSIESLLNNYGGRNFRCIWQEPGNSLVRHISMQFRDYIHYICRHNDLDPLYLFDSHIPEELTKGVLEPQFCGRDCSKDICGITKFLNERRWLMVGGAGSGSPLHVDPINTVAWNLVVEGRKHWIFLPPAAHPPGLEWEADGSFVAPGVALWLHAASADELQHRALGRMGAMEIEQGPGDIVFVPPNWWHLVVNLEPTVAYTENCITHTNLQDVMESLERIDEKTVAGCMVPE